MFIKFNRKNIFIGSGIICLVALVGGYFYFSSKSGIDYESITAKRGDIIQEVSVTGKIKPAKSVDLAFEKSGKVSQINVLVGKKVAAGEFLSSLENSEVLAQLAEAEANLKNQKAKLDQLRRGTRVEEIKIYEAKVESAKIIEEEARKNLLDKLRDSYTKADDAIRNKVDQFFSSPQTQTPQIEFSVVDSSLKSSVSWQRFVLENDLKNWNNLLGQLSVDSDLIGFSGATDNYLEKTRIFLDDVALIINNPNNSPIDSSVSQTTLDGWKSNISTARTNINTAITNLSSAKEELRSAQSSLKVAEQELALKKAGATSEEIVSQEALVEQAEANILNYKAQLGKTIIYAPIGGIITKINIEKGEIVSANEIAISMISESKFEIEANIPEADIAKINIGDEAKITLDAYGGDIIFEARVVEIDPAETIIDGVPTYKTTFSFVKDDYRIKSGMTANIDITTDKKDNVIFVPQRAVISRGKDKIVKILEEENIKEIVVKVGLKGSDGNIEIVEGLKEGDKVIISAK